MPDLNYNTQVRRHRIALSPVELRVVKEGGDSAVSSTDELLSYLQRRDDREHVPSFLCRLVEIIIAATVLTATLPLQVLIGICIKLDSDGPALFRQKRIGRGGKLFTFVKFRTYHADAHTRFPELYSYNYTDEQISKLHFKVPNDPRATRVGAWLRKSTLDELPNFWNLLTGDVALVGPRPEIPEMLPYYRRRELAKFSVRPGITGLAQVSGRGLLSFRGTVKYDLAYVRLKSARLDAFLLARTVEIICKGVGAF